MKTKLLLAAILTIGITSLGYGQNFKVATCNADGLISPDATGYDELKNSPAAPRNTQEYNTKASIVGQYIARVNPGFVGVQDIDPDSIGLLATQVNAAAQTYMGNSPNVQAIHTPARPGHPGDTLGALSLFNPADWTVGAPYQLEHFKSTANYFIVPVVRTPDPTHILWMVIARYHGDETQAMADLFAEIDKRATADTEHTIGIVVYLSGPNGNSGPPTMPSSWTQSLSPPFGTKYGSNNSTTDWVLAGGAIGIRNSQVGGLALSIAQITPDNLHTITRHQVVYAQLYFQ